MSQGNVPSTPESPQQVQRQIALPISKAVEIAWKNIRLRLSRSLLVTSGIILALMFLMSIQTGEAMVNGMREWANTANETPEFDDLRNQAAQLDAQRAALDQILREAARAGAAATAAELKDKPPFDPAKSVGTNFSELRKELRELPGAPDALAKGLTLDPSLVPTLQKWVNVKRLILGVEKKLNAPRELLDKMKLSGEATTAQEIADRKLQTNWLLGLALLVAFVGILNAMLMSVTERFREIGTMKCLGALDSFIVKLFVIESLFQGFVGTILGITIGLLLTAASLSATYGAYAWKNVPLGSIAEAALLSTVIGVGLTLAGAVLPAWQAARMEPIAAMRVEA